MGSRDVESWLSAGERALYTQGDLNAARRCYDNAYREAERQGDSYGIAEAALGLGGLWVHEHRTAADAAMVRARQRHALTLIDPRSSLSLRLRARLAGEEDYRAGGHGAIMAMLTEARQAGHSVALAETLSMAHHCVLGPGHGAIRLELAQELIGEASRTGRRGDLLMGLLWRTSDLFLTADPHAERSLEELRELLAEEDHLAVGFVVDALKVMLLVRAGRFDQAEALAGVCAERGTAAGDADAIGWYGGQLGGIRWYQGRVSELVPLLSDLVNSPTLSAVDNSYFAGLAVAAASAGERRLAVATLARLRGQDLADLPRSSSWLTSMYGIVEAAHLLEDADTAAQAYDLLLPYAGLPMLASLGVTCFGSVHHGLGVASLTTGDIDRAVDHLRSAIHDNLALGHWPALVLSRMRLGQTLALRHGPRDPESRRELTLAAQEATRLGMTLPAAVRPKDRQARPGRRAPVVDFARRGRQWRVELDGRTALVDHSVGMRHLATLLANPGREIPAADLVAGLGLPGDEKARSAQPVLDDEARRKYKQRLAELREEIDELERSGGSERAEALRAERDWLIAELAAATGMGGRPRRFADSDERARIAVGKAIRRALDRITEADPVIGEELRATVQTGLRCCYRPL
ncbi:hypothetical protein [Sphaerisporangium corydalis]|uniref:MalT-like TPR region domain-containing protein n=1 Tax=Sphaerisporangium corydalis TaxID=1441875 RepID=A0ABV9ER78_9ACTN|nr:hypothetical protein [Sphaerisporangium corydalis]